MYGYEEQIISKISVEGKSKMSFDPDVTIVRIEVKEIKKDYEALMKTASERTEISTQRCCSTPKPPSRACVRL